MTDQSLSSSGAQRTTSIVALVLMSLSLLWYGSQVIQFGVPTVAVVDLLGAYFVLNVIALFALIRSEVNRIGLNRFLFFVCAINIPVFALFLGQFLSTFDPFYRVGHELYPYLLRGLFLGASATTLMALGPTRFFRFPRWILVVAVIVTAGWLFVYACPSVVREWYGTRTAPSELFPEGILIFRHPNPERDIQGQMLFASAVAWLVVIIVGRIRYRRAGGRSA